MFLVSSHPTASHVLVASHTLEKLQLLSHKWRTERQRAEQAESVAKQLKDEADTTGREHKRFARLQKAHTAQSKYIQKLQSENAKITVFKTTIRTQEKVIGKLQDLIEAKLKDRRRMEGGLASASK